MGPKNPLRGTAAGYTLVEVMVTTVIATVGFVALLNLQVSSLSGMAHARNSTVAVQLGEHFIEMVRARTLMCPTQDKGNPDCQFRPEADDSMGTWKVLETSEGQSPFAPNSLDYEQEGSYDYGISTELGGDLQRNYCLHYRTAWIMPDSLLRVEARVIWPRTDTDIDQFSLCSLALVPPPESGQSLMVDTITTASAFATNVY